MRKVLAVMAGPDLSRGFYALHMLVLSVVLIKASDKFYMDQKLADWTLGDYGPCSSPCGGGVQSRHVTCVRRLTWPGYSQEIEIKVADIDCPEPVPPNSRTCNNHRCRAHWSPKEWSTCSTSCGVGTQTRQVLCEVSWTSHAYLPGGDHHVVSDSDCGNPRPITSRACHLMDCPITGLTDQAMIDVENYTLWQLGRTRRIKANVGGELNLLPGQTVVVRCPVRHTRVQELIYWSKDSKLVSLSDHMTIRRANPTKDAGTYTCTAQHDTAQITINFVKKNNPVSEFYKKWRRKTHNQKQMAAAISKTRAFTRSHEKRGVDQVHTKYRSSSSRRKEQRDQSGKSRRRRHKRGDEKRRRRQRSLTPTFVTGAWSKCNATCRLKGQMSRKVTCSLVTRKYAKVVMEDECLKAGLVKPNTRRQCFYSGRCALWSPGPWTQCKAVCGSKLSYKARTLVCQWSDTKELAWQACDPLRKPQTLKPCKPKPCSKVCRDQSRSCKQAVRLRMCRYKTFQRKCCQSCKKGQQNNQRSWRKSNLV